LKLLCVALKTLREAWREPQLTGLLMVFPALLILIYFYGYGQSGQGLAQMISVRALNLDEGTRGTAWLERVGAAQFDGAPVFQLSLVGSRAEGEVGVREGQAAVLAVIPASFSADIAAGRLARVELTGDPSSDLFIFAQGFLDGVTQDFGDDLSGWQRASNVTYTFIPGTGKLSDFQAGIPGVLVFGILFNVMAAAIFMVREERSGTLRRLRLARLGAVELLGGMMLALAVLALAQMALALVVAGLYGFVTQGSLWLVALVGLLVSLIATGCGFLTACFSRDDGEAANLSMVFIAPLAFLSGAVFPMPQAPLFSLGGRVFQVYDLLPTAHAANALKRVLIFGDGVGGIQVELIALFAFTLLFIVLGAEVYRRKKLV
jgi:ABC-2 type transport system permease protein